MKPQPQHHPGDDWLLSYAAGTLDEAPGVVMAAHVEMCPRCRIALARADAVGGALLSSLPPTAMSDGSLDLLMRQIDGQDKVPEVPPGNTPAAGLPMTLAMFMPDGIDALPWKWLGPGARGVRLPVRASADNRLWILEAKPGALFPAHAHRGNEMNIILRGSYRANGILFSPGDVEDSADNSHHRIEIDPDEGCLCLVYCEGLIRPDGLIPKILQRFTGF